MSTTYDWSPVFGALGGLGQQLAYRKMLQGMFGDQQGGGTPAAAPGTPSGWAQNGTDAEGNPAYSRAPSAPAQSTGGAFGGNMAKMLPLLQMMGPQAAMPFLLQTMMKQNEYDPTPRIGTNPNTGKLDQYLVSKGGSGVKWLGVQPREKMEVSNNTAYNPYEIKAGDTVGTQKPEKPIINEASGQISYDNGKTFQPIPDFIPRAASIAAAKREPKPPNPNAPIQLVHPSAGY